MASGSSKFPLVEGLIGAAIGATVEILNAWLFENSHAGLGLGIAVAVGGVLLSVQRGALERSFERQLEPLRKLQEYLDLAKTADYPALTTLVQSYASINETEFEAAKQQVVSDASDRLSKLASQKRSSTLQTGVYYNWLFAQFKRLKKGEYVHAISLSSEEEWNDTDLERNFLAANIAAGKKGVDVSRIFVVSEARLEMFLALPPIQAHTTESDIPLKGRWARREDLQRQDPSLLRELGEGFIDFNGKVGLEDKFDPSGAARGDVTMLAEDLRKMRSLWERLLNMTVPLSNSLPAQLKRGVVATDRPNS